MSGTLASVFEIARTTTRRRAATKLRKVGIVEWVIVVCYCLFFDVLVVLVRTLEHHCLFPSCGRRRLRILRGGSGDSRLSVQSGVFVKGTSREEKSRQLREYMASPS